MQTDVSLLDLRLRRRGALGYSVGTAAYALLIVALYPTFQNDTSLDKLTTSNPTLGALFGATGSLTSPDGWMNANLYANFVPLFALFMTIGYGALAIAGQDEDGTLAGIVSQPLTRGQLLTGKILALAVLAVPVPVVTLVAALVGRGFDVVLPLTGLLEITVLVAVLAFDLGLVALTIGAWTGRRGTALGVTVTLAFTAYVISSLAPVVGWIHAVRYLSPFYWSVGAGQLRGDGGVFGAVLLVLLGGGLVPFARAGFRRLDVH